MSSAPLAHFTIRYRLTLQSLLVALTLSAAGFSAQFSPSCKSEVGDALENFFSLKYVLFVFASVTLFLIYYVFSLVTHLHCFFFLLLFFFVHSVGCTSPSPKLFPLTFYNSHGISFHIFVKMA
jgi:hypothetical protein